MKNIYAMISECNTDNKNIVATVTTGGFIGQQILISNDETKYCSKDEIFDETTKDLIREVRESKIITSPFGSIFCEILGGEKKLVICGGGHVSIPIIKIGKMLGFHIVTLEDRPSFADNARRAGSDEVLCEPFEDGLDKISGDEDTYFVIVTRGHRYDQVCLAKILEKQHAYIGMIGSKLRIKNVKELLIEQGISRTALEEVYAPIGLNIKAETPEEIGVAIMAEIIQIKNQIKRSDGYSKILLSQMAANDEEKMPCVLATIISRKGSAPRDVGTKMLISQDGKTIGTIGGGCVEAEMFQRALIMTKETEMLTKICKVDMTGKEAEEDGMVCGGVIEVMLERIS